MSSPLNISTMSAKKRALLKILLEKEGLGAKSSNQILPSKNRDRAFLSFAQQRFWFLDKLIPGDNFRYNIPVVLWLEGPLNVSALEQSLNEIVRRHQVLRTSFPAEDGQPYQAIAPGLTIPLLVEDVGLLPEAEREAEILRLVSREIRLCFDLARGPLVSAKLLRLSRQDHVFILLIHHIVFDGWSVGIFSRELMALYEAFSTGQPSPLSELSIQYADYAVWQRQWLQGEVLENLLDYWKEQLAGAPPALELPTDRPRSAWQTFSGARHPFVLSQPLLDAIKALSLRAKTTLFMTLLAAFKVLLFRYTRQDTIVVGTPTTGRNRTEVEGLIGCFINTLVLRTTLSNQPTFRQFLDHVREVVLGAYAHQDLPFERLVEELQADRNPNRTPLFQVIFLLQNYARSEFKMKDISLTGLRLPQESANFELSMSLTETAEGVSGSLGYSTDLFDVETIARMAGHYQRLLQSIVANPDQHLLDLPLLTENERHQLLVTWNETEKEYSSDKLIPALFEAQVKRTPDRVALVFEDQHLTYRELNRRANQLAHYLRALGVGPETLVGVCMQRSLDMVIGLYGVLKAGGAYVPIDPADPRERQAFMVTDAPVSVLLTRADLALTLPDCQVQRVCLDRDWDVVARQSGQNPVSQVEDANLAYVIYTSGSTGNPKGAMNTHAGIRNRLLWMQDVYRLGRSDRVLQKTPFSFDVSVWEFFWPLLTGACLVVARPDAHKESVYLVETVIEREITTMHFVPSMLRAFVKERGIKACHSLRRVICSGEALPLDLQESFFTLLDVQLHNLYGPTEAAVDVTFWPCEPETERQTVPIGRPIANLQIYLLDPRLQPVPIGVPGELHIGGVGLARGYLGRAGLTGDKFIPNPFSPDPGSRLYKSGDLARYLPDGNIEFLGRIDHQVKVRGFRIELGEIETVLGQHPAIRQAVILVREDGTGDRRLVAYVVPTDGQVPTADQLRAFLKKKLPDYMLPSLFVELDTLPLTSSGKVDRKSLPAPGPERPSLESPFVAPRTPLEEALADVWRDVLGLEEIGVYDDFFDLGGHSLRATRLVSRIHEAFQVELPLNTLFERTTIASLVPLLNRRGCKSPDSLLVPIQPGGRKRPFFCVHPVGGSVFCYTELARRLGQDRPFYGIQARGLNGEPPLFQIETMATNYVEAIRGVQPTGPYLLGGWSMGAIVAYEMAQQLRSQGQPVAVLAVIDMLAPRATRVEENAVSEENERVYLLPRFASQLFGVPVERLSISQDDLLELEPERRLIYVLERAKNVAEVPLDVESQSIQHHFDVFRANVRAVMGYVARPYPGRVSLFVAGEGGKADEDQQPCLGWSRLAQEGVEIHTLPGDHFGIVESPHVQALAERLRSCLDRVRVASQD